MDELAIKLQKDPVQLRLSLDTLIDEEKNKPFSSRHLKECLEVGSKKFGWEKRTPTVGSMRKGDLILGWGVAAASWSAGRGVSEASVSLCADGSARVSSGSQDPGTGTYTVIAQIVSDKTGIPVSRINPSLAVVPFRRANVGRIDGHRHHHSLCGRGCRQCCSRLSLLPPLPPRAHLS